MSRSLIYWLLLGLWFILGWWLCRNYICGASVAAATPAVVPEAVDTYTERLDIKDGALFATAASNGNIRFLNSSFNNLPNAEAVQTSLQSTADYLKANPERSLLITGHYMDSESYTGALPNLGIARATSIKNILAGMGAPTNQMDVRGEMRGSITNSTDTLINSVGFAFAALANADDRLQAISDRLLGKPLTLYFETNADNLSLSSQQRQDFADLAYYLDNVAAANLSVGGHTDDRGEARYNTRLSRNRAEFIVNYIVQNAGINAQRLSSQGFGEDRPVESNDTSEGRAKNRRVEVTLQQ